MIELHLIPTSENPYAWDFPDQNGQFPANPVDELESYNTFLTTNYAITTIIGGLLSFTLLYLIIFQTIGPLKNYRNMLLLCSFTDILYWALDNICGAKIKEKDGVFMIKIEGPAKYFNRQIRLIFVSSFVYTICLINSVLCLQIYFRYYALTRSHFLTTARTISLYILSLSVALPSFFLAYLGYDRSCLIRPDYNYGLLWFREVPLPPIFYADVRSMYQKMYFLYGGILVSGSYTFAILIGYRTMKKIRVLYSSCSERTKHLQTQLSNFLIVQSIIPLLVCVMPLLLIVVPAFFYYDTGRTCMIYGVLLSWLPMLNPLITMIVIVPYRKLILQKLCFVKKITILGSNGNSGPST